MEQNFYFLMYSITRILATTFRNKVFDNLLFIVIKLSLKNSILFYVYPLISIVITNFTPDSYFVSRRHYQTVVK